MHTILRGTCVRSLQLQVNNEYCVKNLKSIFHIAKFIVEGPDNPSRQIVEALISEVPLCLNAAISPRACFGHSLFSIFSPLVDKQ